MKIYSKSVLALLVTFLLTFLCIFLRGKKFICFLKKNGKKIGQNLESFLFVIFSLLWSHIFTQIQFFGQITILSCKTIIGPAFSVILENLVEQFLRKFPKTVILGRNGYFLAHLAKIGKNENFYKKSGCAIFTLIVPQLHAEFQKNRWSGFRDQFVTDGQTNIRTRMISQNRSLSLVQYLTKTKS